MTSNEFVLWLKGFTEGVHEYNITPKQWDLLKEKLKEVEDKTLILESPKFPFGTPNTAPIMPLPHYPNPLENPYKITCSSGSFGTITTPNTQGYITTYNPITFTTTGYPIGSNVTYTNGGNDIKD
jgi:hypothetical protein